MTQILVLQQGLNCSASINGFDMLKLISLAFQFPLLLVVLLTLYPTFNEEGPKMTFQK